MKHRFRRWRSYWLPLVFLAVLAGATWSLTRNNWFSGGPAGIDDVPATSATNLLAAGDCEIVAVLDGRTLLVRQAGRDFRVRLIGVAQPDDSAADSARQALHKAAPPGSAFVELDKRRAADDGAWLAYLYVEGRLVNLEPLRAGWCRYDPHPGDSMTIARQLRDVQANARLEKRGQWQTNSPPP